MNNFQIAKVQPRVLLSIFVNFDQFQSGVAYKGVACKKKRLKKRLHKPLLLSTKQKVIVISITALTFKYKHCL